MPKLLTQGVSLEPKNGRQLIGIVAGFKSERWPVLDRNAGRLQLGIRSYPVSEVSQRLGVSQHVKDVEIGQGVENLLALLRESLWLGVGKSGHQRRSTSPPSTRSD